MVGSSELLPNMTSIPLGVDLGDESAERVTSHRLEDEVETAPEPVDVRDDVIGAELAKSTRPR